jgi:hypothetical protein
MRSVAFLEGQLPSRPDLLSDSDLRSVHQDDWFRELLSELPGGNGRQAG